MAHWPVVLPKLGIGMEFLFDLAFKLNPGQSFKFSNCKCHCDFSCTNT